MEAVKEILVKNDGLLRDIQEMFTGHYPFLQIDFFEIGQDLKLLRSTKIDSGTSLKQLKYCNGTNKININSYRTVAEISHEMENVLGVLVQVSRKSGNIWNIISVTAGWTLKSQNAAGEFISSEMSGDSSLPKKIPNR
jgi:hypothetical protein